MIIVTHPTPSTSLLHGCVIKLIYIENRDSSRSPVCLRSKLSSSHTRSPIKICSDAGLPTFVAPIAVGLNVAGEVVPPLAVCLSQLSHSCSRTDPGPGVVAGIAWRPLGAEVPGCIPVVVAGQKMLCFDIDHRSYFVGSGATDVLSHMKSEVMQCATDLVQTPFGGDLVLAAGLGNGTRVRVVASQQHSIAAA
jgi:hypothetical protein